jgi:hypothetical protein
MRVEASGPFIFGMHRQGADAGDLGSRQRPADRVFQQGGAKAPPLVLNRHGMAGLKRFDLVAAHPAPPAGGCSATSRSSTLGSCGNHERLPLLPIQLEGLPIGQGLSRAGQGTLQHKLAHAALGRRGRPLQGLLGSWGQPQIQLLASQRG